MAEYLVGRIPEGAADDGTFLGNCGAGSWLQRQEDQLQMSSRIGERRGKTSLQPIFVAKILDAGEFVFMIGNNGVGECQSLRCNQQIVAANWSPGFLKLRPN